MLKVQNLLKSYQTSQGAIEVLKGVSFKMDAGESVALMGESGCGKSTLLHVLSGLEPSSGGTIWLNGKEITQLKERDRAAIRRTQLSLVFQQFNLITSMTVHDNLAFEAKLAGRYDPAWEAELIERLKLGDTLTRYPEELSGGQQQRLAIGRTFAAKPSLVLADEPTGNLDEENSEKVLDLAYDLIARTGCALLIVTHSERVAHRADRTLTLTAGSLA